MEVAEGEDLSQRISRGPIPIDEASPIAKQNACDGRLSRRDFVRLRTTERGRLLEVSCRALFMRCADATIVHEDVVEWEPWMGEPPPVIHRRSADGLLEAFEQDLRDVRVLRLLDASGWTASKGHLASRRRSARSAPAAASSRPKRGTWGPKDKVPSKATPGVAITSRRRQNQRLRLQRSRPQRRDAEQVGDPTL